MEPVSSSPIPNIPRPNEHERLVAFLLDQRFFLPVAISTSLTGARGFGKTTLAKAICEDPRVREAFSEGIYWVTLGQDISPLDLVSRVEQLIFDLTGERTVLEDVETAEAQLHELLHPRKTLLVIDEADNEEAMRPFLHAGPGGACLLITHDDTRLPLGARRVSVDIMMPQEATALLSGGLPSSEPSPETPEQTDEENAAGLPDQPDETLTPGVGEMVQAAVLPADEPSAAEVVEDALPEAAEPVPAKEAPEMAADEAAPEAEPGVGEAAQEGTGNSPEPQGPDETSDAIDQAVILLPEPLASQEGTILVDSAMLAEIEKEARVANSASPETARLLEALADMLNEWPLLLSLVNGLLRGCFELEDPACQTRIDALHIVHDALDRQGMVSGWRIDDAVARQRALASVVAACLDPLDPNTRERYLDLAVFPAGENIPLAAASVLWSLDVDETNAEIERLAHRGLLDVDAGGVTFHLQNAVHACLIDQLMAGQLTALHTRLIEEYQNRSPDGWASGPDDGYYFQHLAWHLIAAGQRQKLQGLLFNFEWLFGFLNCKNCPDGRRADMYSLLGDFERALSIALDNQSAQLRLVQDALRLSMAALAQDLDQLAPQLLGRLLPFKEPEIQGLIKRAATWRAGPWLRPLAACFNPPGADEVRVLTGHSDWVTGVAILPDGQRAVSCSLDGTLRVWDLANGQTQNVISVAKMGEEASEIISVVSGLPRGTGSLGNTGQLAGPPRNEPPGGVSSLVITPDGQKVITAGWDGMVRIWNLSTGHEERAIPAHIEAVGALAITPDGKRVISAADDRLIRVWDLVSGEMQLELAGHADVVRTLIITPDGRTLISGSWDYTLRIWDLDNGALMQILPGHEGWVQALAVSPDGYHVLSSSWDRTVRVWDMWTGETVREITGFQAPVFAMIVSHDNRLLIAGAGDGSLSLWDMNSGECLRTLAGHAGGINALALTSGGRFAVSASDDRTLRVWDLVAVQGVEPRPGHTAPVHALAALPDSNQAISASWDGSLKVWEPSAGREVRSLNTHTAGVVAMALAADGRRVLSGSRDHMLKLWDLLSGEELVSLTGHESPITCVAMTPDASLAASGDDAGVVMVWNLASGECLAEFRGEASIWACALTPDGKTVMASESSGKMYFLAIEK